MPRENSWKIQSPCKKVNGYSTVCLQPIFSLETNFQLETKFNFEAIEVADPKKDTQLIHVLCRMPNSNPVGQRHLLI